MFFCYQITKSVMKYIFSYTAEMEYVAFIYHLG